MHSHASRAADYHSFRSLLDCVSNGYKHSTECSGFAPSHIHVGKLMVAHARMHMDVRCALQVITQICVSRAACLLYEVRRLPNSCWHSTYDIHMLKMASNSSCNVIPHDICLCSLACTHVHEGFISCCLKHAHKCLLMRRCMTIRPSKIPA